MVIKNYRKSSVHLTPAPSIELECGENGENLLIDE